MSILQKTSDDPSIFTAKVEYKFSSEFKHTGVTVVSDTLIKSGEAYNYHFALMEPSITESGNKPTNVSFLIKENVSNWLGVGVCYKNAIKNNNYTFNYSGLGHGAYLISSNGGMRIFLFRFMVFI
jgi:hypothetical protein